MKALTYLVSLLLLLNIHTASAAELRSNGQITILEPVTDDLYLAAEKITVSAKVTGDVVAGGGTIRINDSIDGDVILAGGTIEINGYVTDDIRAFGGSITINRGAGGDLLIFGGTVVISRDAEIMGDVVVFGGDVEINGSVGGNITSYGGRLWLYGDVAGKTDLRGGELLLNSTVSGDATLVAEKIDLGNNARFDGSVRYWTKKGEIDFGTSAPNARFDPELGEAYEGPDKGWSVAGFLGFLLLAVLASLLLSTLLIFGFHRYFSAGALRFRHDFFKSFGFGLLYFIGFPVLILLLMISVFGIPLALLGIALYIFTLVYGPTFGAVMLAYWFKDRYKKSWGHWTLLWISGALFLGLCLLISIPFIGWLIGILLIGATFGALILAASQKEIPASV